MTINVYKLVNNHLTIINYICYVGCASFIPRFGQRKMKYEPTRSKKFDDYDL